MEPIDRRSFLAGLGGVGAGVATGSWLETIGDAQSRGLARAFVRRAPGRADFDSPPRAGRMSFKLPPRSYTVALLSLKA